MAAALRVVLIQSTFGNNMGYIENALPKALADLGATTHVVTSQLQSGFHRPNYRETYEPLNGPAVQPAGTTERDGFALHRLPCRVVGTSPALIGLRATLQRLRPDVVQTFSPVSLVALQAALLRRSVGYSLFTGSNRHASVTRLVQPDAHVGLPERIALRATRTLPGRMVGRVVEKCYVPSTDCWQVARDLYGMPEEKLSLIPLGTDTTLFHPVRSDDEAARRQELRQRFGFEDGDVVCIYTGRLDDAKGPLLLAEAVSALRAGGRAYRGLFVGSGSVASAIAAHPGCSVTPFVPWKQLADYYRAADVAVWPRQESLSMIDAAACGLPVVISGRASTTERYEGNGRTYAEGDPADLARVLGELGDAELRLRLGSAGAEKMRQRFGWRRLAGLRLADYEAAARRLTSG